MILPLWAILLFIALLLVVGAIAVIMETRVAELTKYINRLEREMRE